MVLALVTVRNGRLGPAIVTHASFNMLTVIAYAVSR
jgi:membrane protease YdiL (CAAX protease family)